MPEKPTVEQPTMDDLLAQLAEANRAAEAAREEAARANGEKMMARATLDALQAMEELKEAKRQLALGDEPDDLETEADMVESIRSTDAALRAQKKFLVELYLSPDDEGKGLFEIVQVNGAAIYQIERGAPVEVPESIYQALVASHLRVRPQRREDYSLVPITIKSGMRGPGDAQSAREN